MASILSHTPRSIVAGPSGLNSLFVVFLGFGRMQRLVKCAGRDGTHFPESVRIVTTPPGLWEQVPVA